MRRLLISMTALSLLWLVNGCRTIGEGCDGDCECGASCADGSCGAMTSEVPLPATVPGVVPGPSPAAPASPEAIKEMPRVEDGPKTKTDDVPLPLPSVPEGVDLK